MTGSPDWLINLFLFTFLFGLIFTVISLVLGVSNVGGFDFGGADVDVDLGGGDGGSGDGTGHAGPGLFNIPTIMAFFTWFGGAGYIFTQYLNLGGLLAAPLAVLSGLLGGGIMFFLLARLLWPMMTKPMSSKDFHIPGTSARVVSPIRAGGVGEVVYSKSGSRFTAGARSIDDAPIEKGMEVVIIKYERGIAFVQPVDSILGEKGGEAEGSG